MIRNVVSFLALVSLLVGTADASDIVLPAPTIFAPGVISSPANDGTPTFSPDGRTLYITYYGATYWGVIFESHRTTTGWSKPVIAPFSGPSSDVQPAFAPDGRSLVFVSRRKTSNLWHVVRTPTGVVFSTALARYRQYRPERA